MKTTLLLTLSMLAACTSGVGQLTQSDSKAATQSVPARQWWNIGPAPNIEGRYAYGGRVASLAVDPSNPDHWLAGTAGGGIWDTRDAGLIWVPRTDDQPSLAMGAVAFSPSEPLVVYAGTGEASLRSDAFAGAGLLRSDDGGLSWRLIASSNLARASFKDLVVDPHQSSVLVAATTRGAAGRLPDRMPRGNLIPGAPPRGLWKSTDGGTNWSLNLEGEATELEVNPADFNRQYAGLGEPFGAASNGVYRSFDAGSTWSKLSGPWGNNGRILGRVSLAIAPSNPNVAYVSIAEIILPDLSAGDKLVGLWKSTNAWETAPTWSVVPRPSDAESGLWYHHVLSVDPFDSAALYFGSVHLYRLTNSTWTKLTARFSDSTPQPRAWGDFHALTWTGSKLIVGNDSGVWSSTDRFATAINHNTTLSTIQFYAGALHPTNPDLILGGSQDNGMAAWTGSPTWEMRGFGDGIAMSFSSRKPDTHMAYLAEWVGDILRTTDDWRTSTEILSGLPDFDFSLTPFVAPFEHSPVDDEVFLLGIDRLYKCTNFYAASTPVWSANSPGLTKTISGTVSGLRVTTAAFAAGDLTGKTYAYAHENGLLRLTKNGGVTWTDPDLGNAVPNRYVTKLAFDPRNTNILYVALSGFDEGTPGQPGHLFRTTNALAALPTWQDISPPANLPHDCIAIDPVNPSHLWVGTDVGLWESADAGASWTHHGPEMGMPNVPVFDIQLNPTTGRIAAFTHGRGAFLLSPAGAANLHLTQNGPTTAALACDLTLTFTVLNDSLREATGVALSNSLPAGAVFISATASQGSCLYADGAVSCDLGVLPRLGQATVQLVVRPATTGLLTNTATVTAHEPDLSPARRIATRVIGVTLFTRMPLDQATRIGASITNRVVTASCRPLTHQWQFNGVPIPGATSTNLILTHIQLSDEGDYTVAVNDGVTSAMSNPGRLAVLIDPVITVAPVSQAVVAGGSATFSVAFTGNPMPFGVEWRQSSNLKASNTVLRLQDFYTLTNAKPSLTGTWRVLVRNLALGSAGAEQSRTFTLTVLPDSDGDGLPDVWEIAHGFPTNNPANATLDTDGDGLTNAQEYQAGTNPTNALSYLKVDSASLVNGGQALRLTFFAASNNTYTVESRSAVDAGAWSRVADVIAASSNRVVEVLDTAVLRASGPHFYRLVTPRIP